MSKLFIFIIIFSIAVALFSKSAIYGFAAFLIGIFLKIIINMMRGVGEGAV